MCSSRIAASQHSARFGRTLSASLRACAAEGLDHIAREMTKNIPIIDAAENAEKSPGGGLW